MPPVGSRRALLTKWTPEQLPGCVFGMELDRSPFTRAQGMAAQFTALNSESLSHAASAALNGTDATNWWRCGWGYLDSIGTKRVLLSTLSGNAGIQVEVTAANVLMVSAGNGSAVKTATHATALGTATWFFWYAENDGTNIGISLNAGALVQTLIAAPFSAGAATFAIGADVTPANFWDGRQQCVFGGNGTLTTAQQTAARNGGVPLAFDQWGGVGAAPLFAYELNEPSGVRTDLVSLVTLTDNNTVTTNPGTCLNAASQVNDLSGNGNHATQSTQAARPVLRAAANGQGSHLALRFDGVDDLLRADGVAAAFAGSDKPLTVIIIGKADVITSNQGPFFLGSGAAGNPSRYPQITGSAYKWVNADDGATHADVVETVGTATTANHVFAFVFTGTTISAFIDGVVRAEINAGSSDVGTATFTISAIGARALSGNGSQFWPGLISGLWLYNRAVSVPELRRVDRYGGRKYGISAAIA